MPEENLLNSAGSSQSTSASSQEKDEVDYADAMEERLNAFKKDQRRTTKKKVEQKEEEEVMGNTPEEQSIIKRERSSTLYSKLADEATTLDDFTVKSIIGQGSFGKVFLVQHKGTQKVYAMKVVRKDVVVTNDQVENLRLEKHILLCVDHPFIINMEFVFQKSYRIYFLMDFMKGGELYKQL